VRRTQAEVHCLPDDSHVPIVSEDVWRLRSNAWSMTSKREAGPDERRRLIVVAAVIEQDDSFLLTRRIEGTHLAGFWEFPGGKIASGETHAEALMREIREELDSGVEVGPLVFETEHEYSDRSISLHFYRCTLHGSPRPLLGQQMRWVSRTELRSLDFPPADEELIRRLTERESR
jgi:8-oxo-dGTP diphosphatase